MTGTDLCVNKPQSVPVIFEPPCTLIVPRYLRPHPLPSLSFPAHPSAVIVPFVTVVWDASCIVK